MIELFRTIGSIFIFLMVIGVLRRNTFGKNSVPDATDTDSLLGSLMPWFGAAAAAFAFYDLSSPGSSKLIPLVGALFVNIFTPASTGDGIVAILLSIIEFFGVLLAFRTISKNALGKNSVPESEDADGLIHNGVVWLFVAFCVWAAMQFTGGNNFLVQIVGEWITKLLSGDLSGTLTVLRLV